MSESNEYDGVVLGESPAGLWVAKQMIAKGFKMLVIPTTTASPQNFLPKEIVEEFRLESVKTKREAQPLQIITSKYRFRAYHDETLFKNEYEFQFGKPFSLNEMPDASFLRGLSYWVRGGETGPVLPDELPTLYTRFFATEYFDESPGFVIQSMLKELEFLGVHISKPGSLQRVFMDRKNMVGIQLSNTTQMTAVPRAFANTHLDYLNTFFTEPMELTSQPLGWRFEIRFECAPEAIPVGLSDRMIFVEEGSPILEIFQEKPGHFRLATMLPYQDFTLNRGEQKRLASRMLKVCESILPDLEYNLKKVSPDLRDPERAMSVDLPAMYPFQELRRIPSHLLIFGSGSGSAPINPANGLYITGQEAYPKDTVWGSFEAAKASLKIIDQIIAKNIASQKQRGT